MKHVAVSVCVALMVSSMGCGAKKYGKTSNAGMRIDSNSARAAKAPPAPEHVEFMMAEEAAWDDEGGTDRPDGELSSASDAATGEGQNESPGDGQDPATQPPPPPAGNQAVRNQPMVMYSGFLELRVKRLLEAMDEITEITEKLGGYVESLTERIIVVRIPKGDFEGAMEVFLAVGELIDRRVESRDVTEMFVDLQGRLEVAKEARERMLKLLEEVKKVKQRLKILNEIKRLTETIETIESTMKTLRNLVDYFTITIELEPVLENRGAQLQESPFAWVRNLTAHAVTIDEGKKKISMTLPKGFVLFEDDDTYRAQAADTAVIRAGVLQNEPWGDNGFWSDAIAFEMEGRAEIDVAAGNVGKLAYRLYKSDDLKPRYYLIAVYAMDDDIYVLEVFYPNEESQKAHHEGVIKALETFEVKP